MCRAKLLIVILILLIIDSCQKIDLTYITVKNESKELINNWKDYNIKNNGVYEKHSLDSIANLINYNDIEIKTIDSNSKLFLFKIKSNSTEYLGIIKSKNNIQTIGVIRTDNIPNITFLNEITNSVLNKRIKNGYVLQIYDIHNQWIKKLEGLAENHIKETSIFKKITKGINGTGIKALACYDYYLNIYVDDVLVSSTFLGSACDAAVDLPSDNGGSVAPDPITNIDPCMLAAAHKLMFDSLKNSIDYTSKLYTISQPNTFEMTTTFGKNSNGQIISTGIVNGTSGNVTPNFSISSPFALLHSHVNVSPPSTGDFYNLAKNSKIYPTLSTSITIDANGNMYSLLIVDRNKLSVFYNNNPSVITGGSNVPTFPSIITDDLFNIQDAIVSAGFGNQDAIAMAFSFILNKYNTGVELLKLNNGNFEPIIVTTPDQKQFSKISCPQ